MAPTVNTSANEQRALHHEKQTEQIRKDIANNPDLEGMHVLGRHWLDLDRQQGSSLGNNINDGMVEESVFEKDENGNEIPGTASPWKLCFMTTLTSNWDDARATMPAKLFNLVVADPDGTNKRYESLSDMLGPKFRTVFNGEGLEEGCDMSHEKVAVSAPRFAFIQKPPDEKKYGVKIRYVSFAYNTTNDANPKNVMLMSDTMNTSLHLEKPGRDGPQALYTKVRDAEGEWKEYSTSVKPTTRGIKDIGTETHAEKVEAASRGEGTQVETGPITWKGQSSCAWLIQAEVKPNPPVSAQPVGVPVGVPLGSSGNVIYRSLSGTVGGSVYDEDVHYRSLGCDDDEDEDEASRPKFVRGSAVEARVQIGPFERKAQELTKTKLIAAKTTCNATPFFFVMVKYGEIASTQELINAHEHSKKCHKLTISIGKEIHSLHSAEAVEEGLSHSEPMSKQAKIEFQHNTGVKLPDACLNPTPVLTGIPI